MGRLYVPISDFKRASHPPDDVILRHFDDVVGGGGRIEIRNPEI